MEGKKKISNVSLFHFSPFEKRKTCCNANTRGCERFLRSIILPRQPLDLPLGNRNRAKIARTRVHDSTDRSYLSCGFVRGLFKYKLQAHAAHLARLSVRRSPKTFDRKEIGIYRPVIIIAKGGASVIGIFRT